MAKKLMIIFSMAALILFFSTFTSKVDKVLDSYEDHISNYEKKTSKKPLTAEEWKEMTTEQLCPTKLRHVG